MATQKEWYSQAQSKKISINDDADSDYERLQSKKTTDPEANDYIEAIEMFRNGMKLARMGDYEAAMPQLACAYLLDTRSVNFAMCQTKDVPKDKLDKVLDFEIYMNLCQKHPDQYSLALSVMQIMLSSFTGSDAIVGQDSLTYSMNAISRLLLIIEQDMSIEDPERHIMGGCLTRKELLRLRSALHMAMGNRKNALKDLTSALKIDEFYTTARESRACVWASLKIKDRATIHAEFLRILNESHPDSRGLEVTYAHLALTTLADPSLGTINDAKEYYAKSLKATARRDELYGKIPPHKLPDVIKELYKTFQGGANNLEVFRLAAQMQDAAVSTSSTDSSSRKHSCVFCGAMKRADGSSLLKCSRCKLVSYCSKECQKLDWKSHKFFCKEAINAKPNTKKKPQAQPTRPVTTVTDSIPKEQLIPKKPLDTWEAMIQITKRMEKEFISLYTDFGKFFGDYWKAMSRTKQESILMRATNNTIHSKSLPMKSLSRELITRKPSLCSFELSVETLCSKSKSGDLTLLHEMSKWAKDPKGTFEQTCRLVQGMRDKDIIPDMFSGMHALVQTTPFFEGEEGIMIIRSDAPDHVKSDYRTKINQGKMLDASAAWYVLKRKEYHLSLFIKLFNIYQVSCRRQLPQNPYERVKGCVHCHRSCEDSVSAKQCLVCKVSWFCCEGCKREASHSKCPIGSECDSAVIFE